MRSSFLQPYISAAWATSARALFAAQGFRICVLAASLFVGLSVLALDPGRARRSVNGLPAPRIRVALPVTARLVRPALSPRIDNPRKETALNNPDPAFASYDRYRDSCEYRKLRPI